jgi:hypothetical protein
MRPDREVLLVVLGAGASFDCMPRSAQSWSDDLSARYALEKRTWSEVRPPLAADLVASTSFHNEIIARYPACAPLVAALREPSDVVFEQRLEDIITLREGDPHLKRQLLAMRFYLRDLLASCLVYAHSSAFNGIVTNYTTLVGRLLDWSRAQNAYVCFVTFNYDLLLDRALEAAAGVLTSQLDPHEHGQHVSLLRPHGSVAWEWREHEADDNMIGPLTGIEHAQHVLTRLGREPLEVRDAPVVLDVLPMDVAPGPRRVSIPALALPLIGKPDGAVWPDVQRDFLGSALRGKVTRMLVVGWHAADTHLLPAIQAAASPACDLMVITKGMDEAEHVLEQLGIARHSFPPLFSIEGFSDALQPPRDRDYLAAFLHRSIPA